MLNNNVDYFVGRLALVAIIGLCVGAGIFCVLSSSSGSGHFWECFIVAFLTAVAFFSVYSSFLFRSLYLSSRKALQKLTEQSLTDRLTELYNRRYLEPFLESEIDAAKKENRQISVMMVDMDHFKEINDTYGHIVGDHILAIFARVVLKCLRKTDIIARYGGDEFVVVLPDTDTNTAKIIADRIRREVSETRVPPVEGIAIPQMHCSIGISNYPCLSGDKHALIKTSDQALYMAKRSGRNCTMVYGSKPALG